MASMSTTTRFQLKGVCCSSETSQVERKLATLQGIATVAINPVSFQMTVTHEAPVEAIQQAVDALGYTAEPLRLKPVEQAAPSSFWSQHGQKLATVLSGMAVLAGWLASLRWGESQAGVIGLFALATVVGGFQTFRQGLRSIRARSFDMNALMTIGVTGAILIGEWAEAGAIAFLYAVSNWLEAAAMERTRNSLRGLIEMAPKTARIKGCSGEAEVPVEEVDLDDILVVRPGEKIAMDGVVLEGHSSVNQAPITGESIPVAKTSGSEVFAGTVNGAGALEVRVTKRVEDTTLARIIHMVEDAQSERASVQSFVDRFAMRYTPVVLVLALLVALVPPLFGQPLDVWIYRALALIVLACPCALVVSTPVALVAGIGNAARHGVLIKGGTHLEQAASIRVLAFDKTGTLTQGRPEVQAVIALGGRTEAEVMRLAASVEARSEHPLAAAILRHAERIVGSPQAGQKFEAIVGHGAKAEVDGRLLFVGSPRFFEQQGTALGEAGTHVTRLQEAGNTVVLLGDENEVYGLIAVADPIRPESRAIVAELKRMGIAQVAMLTGDNARTAQEIATQIGVDEVRAELLPEDKVAAVKDLETRFGRVAMVGDGVNDAPALATAKLGIAMGAAGTDVAIETADVALMSDNVRRIPFTMHLSRRTMAIIRQNITFSLVVKLVATVLVFPGWLTLWMAVLSDMGATILVVLNALRLLAIKPAE
ncbi:putative cadmium-transporting ATPase [compost metagenome]